MPARRTPQAINPASGVILNWNNKPARGYRRRGRQLVVRPGAARRPALGRHPAATEAHARERRRRDERRRDPGPAAHAGLAGRSDDVLARRTGDAARDGGGSRSSTRGSQPAAAGSTRTSTGRSTLRAPRSWTPGGRDRQRRARTRARRPGSAPSSRKLVPNTRRSPLGLERVQRLVVVRPEGPPLASRPRGRTAVPDAVLRRRRRREVRGVAVGGARRSNGAAGCGPGRPTRRRGVPTQARSGSSFAPGILARTMRGSNKPTFQQVISFRSHR